MSGAVLAITAAVCAYIAGRFRGRVQGFRFALQILEALEDESGQKLGHIAEQRKAAPWQ